MFEWVGLILILIVGIVNFGLIACELALVAFHYGSKMEHTGDFDSKLKMLYYRA